MLVRTVLKSLSHALDTAMVAMLIMFRCAQFHQRLLESPTLISLWPFYLDCTWLSMLFTNRSMFVSTSDWLLDFARLWRLLLLDLLGLLRLLDSGYCALT